MAKFCPRCGKPIQEGEVCSCSAKQTVKTNISSPKGFFEALKNQIGVGNPILNNGDAFENGKKIIPDCVKSNESEIPVKQYTIATLRNRILGIPYSKAIGRMQVTNKRVIFRAPGWCLAGRTTLQHEFSIDEIAGVEARREYVFNAWDFIWGLISAAIGGIIIMALIFLTCYDSLSRAKTAGITIGIILTLLLGIAGCVPFFLLKKKWLLKLLCLGGSFIPLFIVGNTLSILSEGLKYVSESSGNVCKYFGILFIFLGIISGLLALFSLLNNSIRPNLVLLIKTKAAIEAIDIRRKKLKPFNDRDEHTGYTEVIPADDSEKCIREIDALINDIQKLGDFGIEKWKE